MAMLIADCPRCGHKQMTLDVLASANTFSGSTLQTRSFETFCRCRHCFGTSIFELYNKISDHPPHKFDGTINGSFSIEEVIRPSAATIKCPDYVPETVKSVFDEAAECLAIKQWNAAGAMFRKIVDLASKERLPPAEVAEPSKQIRRNLKARLDWLFANGRLPDDLLPLADCIREDGNDAVHEYPIQQPEAEDVADFTIQLLERLYTSPGKLNAAAIRRAERRRTDTSGSLE